LAPTPPELVKANLIPGGQMLGSLRKVELPVV
jgi:hypothetical protein